MDKEYVFRGIAKDRGWVEGSLLVEPSAPVCFGEPNPPTTFIVMPDPLYTPDWNLPYRMIKLEVFPETVSQYTFFDDKDGKKIFENDVVELVELIDNPYGEDPIFGVVCVGGKGPLIKWMSGYLREDLEFWSANKIIRVDETKCGGGEQNVNISSGN
jgi:hypothetical protein